MFEPFQPVVRAAYELPGKSILLAYAPPGAHSECVRGVNDALVELRNSIKRLLMVEGLPPVSDGYPGGQKGWEFDVKHQLGKLSEAAHELAHAAIQAPSFPIRQIPVSEPLSATETDAYDRQLQEFDQAGIECARLAERLRVESERLANLQCSVAPFEHKALSTNLPLPTPGARENAITPHSQETSSPTTSAPLDQPSNTTTEVPTPNALAAGETTLPARPEDNEKPNGIFEPFGFRYDGIESEFARDQRRLHRLLRVMWTAYRTRTAVSIDEVNGRLVTLGGAFLERKTLSNYARDLSTILTGQFKLPAKLELQGNYVRWVDL